VYHPKPQPHNDYRHLPSVSNSSEICMAHWHKGAILVSGALIAPRNYSAAGGLFPGSLGGRKC
jgi:hypothetical protein